MKKILATLLTITMLLTTLSTCVIPVSADELAAVATSDIFNETFEGYTTGVNWLTSVENSYIKAADTIEVAENAWSIGGTSTGVTVEVVKGADVISGYTGGNMLHLKGASTTDFFSIRRNSNDGSTGYAIADMNGKQVVLEGDVYVVSGSKVGEVTFLGYSNGAISSRYANVGSFNRLSGTGWIMRSQGAYNYSYYARSYGPSLTAGIVPVRFVYDVSQEASATHSNTSRAYANGTVYSAKYDSQRVSETSASSTAGAGAVYTYAEAQGWDDAKRYSTGYSASTSYSASKIAQDFGGTTYYLSFTDIVVNENYPYEEGDRVLDFHQGDNVPTNGYNAGTYMGTSFALFDHEIYIDNLKAYLVDKFAMGTATNTTNYVRGSTIEIPFNSQVAETVKEAGYQTKTWVLANDLITLVDSDGAVVENGIKSATLSDDKKTVNVVLADTVESKADYQLVIDVAFSDVYGQGLDNHNIPAEIAVHTAEVFEVTEAPESISGLIPNDPRTVTITTSAAVETATADYEGTAITPSVIGGTTVKISFADVATPVDGDLVVTLTAADGQSVTTTIPVTAISDEIDYIYNDNLETLSTGSLVTSTTTGTSLTSGNFIFNTAATSLGAAGTAEIVSDKKQGNVLKLSSNGAGYFSAIYKGDESSVLGKVLVLKTKYYVPSTYKNTSNSGNYGAAASLAESLTDKDNSNTPAFRLRTGGSLGFNSGNYSYNYMEQSTQLTVDDWTEIVTVIDQATKGTLEDPHTSRRYADDTIHTVVSWDKNAGETKTDAKTMYDVPPTGYRGIWDFSKLSSYYTESKSTTFGTQKMYGTYTMLPNTDGTAAYVMMDDFKAFYADKFAVTYISENASAFIPTRHTLKVVFNQKVDKAQLANVTVYDASGAAVEGWSAEVANGDYAYDFKLPYKEEYVGQTFTIAFSPAFHDITSYQGLGSKNKDYEIEVTIAEAELFVGEADVKEIKNFATGRTATAVITLSKAAALTDATVKDAFEVLNLDEEGAAVTEGWTATLSNENKTIVLDFSALETGNYTVTTTAALVDADGYALENTEPIVITITARVGKTLIFEEDFEDTDDFKYEVGKNWLTDGNLPANGKWKVYNTNTDANTKVSVENTLPAEGTKLSGKFLRVVANDSASSGSVYTNVKGLISEIDESLDQYKNKVIVMETDFYATSVANGINPMVASFDDKIAITSVYMKHDRSGFKYEGTWLNKAVTDSIANLHTRWVTHMPNASTTSKNTNGTFTTIIDQRNEMDTVKTLFEGAQLVETSNTLLTDHALYQQKLYEIPLKANNSTTDYWSEYDAGNFQGFIVYGKNQKSYGDSDFYLDNIKVYLVDAFEITGVEGASTAFNVKQDNVTFTFSNPLLSQENAAANIKLVDSTGADVTGGVSVALDDGNYQAVVTVNEAKITGGAEYKIVVSPEIKDEYGQPLAHQYEPYYYKSEGGSGWVTANSSKKITGYYATEAAANAAVTASETVYAYKWTMSDAANGVVNNFRADMDSSATGTFNANGYIRNDAAMKLETVIKTAKSTSLYAEATAANVDGTNVSTTLTFTNPEADTYDVWYIVAAYGQYNEMLGCKAAALEVANGTLTLDDISFTTKSSDIQSVKVYIWDGYKTMVPYQEAETIYGE